MKKNIIKSLKFIILLLLFLVFSFNNIFAIKVELNINESSTLTKLLIGTYSLDSKGVLELYNPSQVSKIYEVNFPIVLDSLIGIRKEIVDNSSNKIEFKFDKIKGYIIEPNETIKVGYHIYGLLNYNIYNRSININKSILEYYIENFNFYTNLIVNLQKPQREGYKYNDDANLTLNSTPSTTNSTRLISSGIRNPTDFDCFIKNINLYKTKVADPYYNQGDLISSKKNVTVDPFDFKELDFFDYFSNEQSVYWVSTNTIIKSNINTFLNSKFIIQKKPSSSKGGSSSGGGGMSWKEIINNKTLDLIDSVLLKKSVNKTIIRSDDTFKVILRVVNINNFKLKDLKIKDEIPEGYEIINTPKNVKISNGKSLEFEIEFVEEYGTYILEYILKNKNKNNGITYLKPAILKIKDLEIFSEGILLINDLLPEKKVFIQKEIKNLDDDYVQVKIKVKNLGTITLLDLLVVDNIDQNAILKEISKIFYEHGSWKIKELKAGEEWEVTYITKRDPSLDTIPSIFGIDNSKVYATLISSEEVVTTYNQGSRLIEKVGLGLSVGLLIFYLLF